MTARREKKKYGLPKDGIAFKQGFESKLPEYKVVNGKDYVMYGENNRYPDYLLEMYQRSAKHNAIVNGKVNYIPDLQGNKIPDFSYAGYQSGNQEIPSVEIKITVTAQDGDATQRIQNAINYVAGLPVDKNGFR